MSDSGTGSVMDQVRSIDVKLLIAGLELTAHVVGPADDTNGVEAAGAAGLVPVHPAIGHTVPAFDRGCKGRRGGDRRSDMLDGRGGREACEEGGEEEQDEGVDGRHRDVDHGFYRGKCISVCCGTEYRQV